MNCLSHGMAQGVVPDQNQMCVIYFTRYNRESGFFFVMFNSTFVRPDFNGAVQCCDTVKPAYNCTTMDQFFGFLLLSSPLLLLLLLLLLQASSVSYRLKFSRLVYYSFFTNIARFITGSIKYNLMSF